MAVRCRLWFETSQHRRCDVFELGAIGVHLADQAQALNPAVRKRASASTLALDASSRAGASSASRKIASVDPRPRRMRARARCCAAARGAIPEKAAALTGTGDDLVDELPGE
jgi:hypothetical protein